MGKASTWSQDLVQLLLCKSVFILHAALPTNLLLKTNRKSLPVASSAYIMVRFARAADAATRFLCFFTFHLKRLSLYHYSFHNLCKLISPKNRHLKRRSEWKTSWISAKEAAKGNLWVFLNSELEILQLSQSWSQSKVMILNCKQEGYSLAATFWGTRSSRKVSDCSFNKIVQSKENKLWQ